MKRLFFSTIWGLFLTVNFVFAQTYAPKVAQPMSVSSAKLLGKTPALRDMTIIGDEPENPETPKKKHAKEVPNHFGHNISKNPHSLPHGADPIRQISSSSRNGIIVEPDVNVEGINADASGGVMPPDPSGEVGKDHYIMTVNAANGAKFQIFDKSGVSVFGPAAMNTFWIPFGLTGFGDPVILYDQAADRWILTEFADLSFNKLLVAVSATSDPLGQWNAYQFETPTFPDYPKYFIWNDAYYVTTNEYNSQNTVPVYALDRNAMLNGAATAGMQEFGLPRFNNVGFQIATGADWDGINPPPVGAPAQIMRMYDDSWDGGVDHLEIWSLHVDWEQPINSFLDGPLDLPTAPFESQVCNGWMDCIAQPNGGLPIDALEQILMYRVQYRNFGNYEAMVCNHVVDVNGNNLAGIRWYELRRTAGQDWSIYQQGTYSPDSRNRWMGSIAMDGKGNIGLGFATMGMQNGVPTYASARFTGRRVSDPLGEMTIEEYEVANGKKNNSGNRFGDYSQMTVDPTDDLKFWFVGEYIPQVATWATKIAAFGISRDTFDIAPTRILTPVSSSTLGANEVVKIQVKNIGYAAQTQFKVGYKLDGGGVVSELVNHTLQPDSIYIHTFVPTLNLSAWGDYSLKVFTTAANDQNRRNDTIIQKILRRPDVDAALLKVTGLENTLCASKTDIKVTFKNVGFQPLTSLKLRYKLNSGSLKLKNWVATSGQPLKTDQINAQTISLDSILVGNNQLIIYTEAPNLTGIDGRNANDSLTLNFSRDSTLAQITLKILTDSRPEETTWTLKDETGAVIYAGGPYTKKSEFYVHKFCLNKEKCYTFDIFDAGSNGFNGGSPYVIRDETNRVLAKYKTLNFGATEQSPFCGVFKCILQATATATQESATGANNGSIIVTTLGGVNAQYSLDNGSSYQTSPVFSNLSAGSYTVLVKDANDCKDTVSTIVELATAVGELQFGKAVVSVSPNPTDGMFELKVDGLSERVSWLKVSIFDATGQFILRDELARFNSTLKSVISISKYPKGVYFARIYDEQQSYLVKIIYQ